MKTVQKIESETDNLKFGWFDNETEEWYSFDDMTEEEIIKLCERADFRSIIICTFMDCCRAIRESVHEDLADIWKRPDKMEER